MLLFFKKNCGEEVHGITSTKERGWHDIKVDTPWHVVWAHVLVGLDGQSRVWLHATNNF